MRDVIHVERQPVSGEPDGTVSRSFDGAWDGPTIDGDSLTALGRVADEVLPSIVARLAVSTLGEIEVRHGDWHVRVRRTGRDAKVAADTVPAAASVTPTDVTPAHAPSAPTRSADIATSPAVGYFVPRPELAVGSRVAQGDVVGWIDVLGVRQEVVAPVDGLVGKLLVAPGDPVENGEELIQLVPGAAKAERSEQEGTPA